MHDNSSDSDFDNNDKEIHSRSSNSVTRSLRRSSPKLPAFTGKETWMVWFYRFEEVANRQGWSQDEKLDELLPRLQGTAGEFVYDNNNNLYFLHM